ncbi:MAG: hypothetical protein H8D78_21255 [Chloroflexi bacterium]|nr:hypothetical protein [Chloroflexota bacterium]
MAKITITKDNVPTSEEFRRMLAEAMAESNPVNDLLEVAEELYEYEQRYGVTSAEFYERFQRGELDDELQHCIRWASAYDVFVKLKTRVETALMREAVWRLEPTEELVPA